MTRDDRQIDLFQKEPRSGYPDGFAYAEELIDASAEASLVNSIGHLTLKEFEFRGYTGKRRVVSFGWRYDFADGSLTKADEIPDFLLELRIAAAAFGGLPPERLQQVLVTEYTGGAGIGWHKDRPVFDQVIGISMLAPCQFRLRRPEGARWARRSLIAAPRSAYRLTGPARRDWEHSIPAVDALRYSVTFRSLKA